jgi:hypothetical protein
MPPVDRRANDPTVHALKGIAKLFNLHLRLARAMYRDGYVRLDPEIPEYLIDQKSHSDEKVKLFNICSYYGLSNSKLFKLYNAGYVNSGGIDLKKAILRYQQRHAGQLSVGLFCHLAYDQVDPDGGQIKDQAVYDCLSALKIDGKLNPPKDLGPYLDAACEGEPEALERVAGWMRDLIESVGRPRRWAFYGVRLALVEGSYVLWNRPVPRLRKWAKRRKLARLLREHHLLRGCVTSVAKPGRNSDYYYMFHRPGEFWNL